jgi:hypothetical protein
MRDRETESWWSIMTNSAIGGPLEGKALVALPFGLRTTWKEWSRLHPETLVLRIGERTYAEEDRYAEYLASGETRCGGAGEDGRMLAQTPVYVFRANGQAIAVSHAETEGGYTFSIERNDPKRVFLFRTPGSPIRQSTRAYRIPKSYLALTITLTSARQFLDHIEAHVAAGRADEEGIEILAGIDTYWCCWTAQNAETRVMP